MSSRYFQILIFPFLLLLLLLNFPTTVSSSSSSVSLFCKCICGTNYTIISLSDPPPPPPNVRRNFGRSPLLELSNFPREDEEKIDNKGGDLPTPRKPTSLAPPPPKTGTCADCTRHLCYSYHLPVCVDQKTKEEDIVTMCFQRDSKKDRLVVCLFVFTTVSLLVYAVLKPWVQRWIDAWREKRSQRYTVLPSAGDDES